MPTTIIESKVIPTEEPSEIDARNRGHHERTWRHIVSDQTEVGGAVILHAQALEGGNRCPEIGETYNYGDLNDAGSYCQRIRAWRAEPAELPDLWHITAYFSPLPEGVTSGTIGEPNPLSWPTVYAGDYLEEQVPLALAVNLDDLSHIGREAGIYGPLVNSCGVEFTDPTLTTDTCQILLARKNYATLDEIFALNAAFEKTVNNDTFFGAPAGTAKYLTTEPHDQQKIGAVTFYPGTTKVIINSKGWDHHILNNGWTHFEKHDYRSGLRYIGVNGNAADEGNPIKHFANMTHSDVAEFRNNPTAPPDVAASEPMNLNYDGLQLFPGAPGVYLAYEELAPVSYAGIGIGGS